MNKSASKTKLNPKKVIKEFNRRAVEKKGIIRVLSDRFSVQINKDFDSECQKLLKKYFTGQNGLILDVGIGIGRLTKYFSKKSTQIVGIDFSEKMLEIANKNLKNKKNLTLICGDIDKANFGNKYFDLGIVSLVLKHNNDARAKKIIKKIKKWCKTILLIEHTGGSKGSNVAVIRSDKWYLEQFSPMKPVVSHKLKRHQDEIFFCILK